MNWLIEEEMLIRLTAFLGVFLLLALLEVFWPRRKPGFSRLQRWPGNLGIVVLNTLLLRLLFPAAAVGAALTAEQQQWGLFNLQVAQQIPGWLIILACVVLLDLSIWTQHLVFHKVSWLWRLHRTHHTDLHFDLTTGLRFHPLEILLSMLIKIAVVVSLGAPAVAVLIFEIVLNATSMFNHSNVRLPRGADRIVRWLVVTPDMHRIHHSWHRPETDSNYGFNLPWWDRLFRTYRDQPAEGHEGMTIGINLFREPGNLRLDKLLWQPFQGPAHSRPVPPPQQLNFK